MFRGAIATQHRPLKRPRFSLAIGLPHLNWIDSFGLLKAASVGGHIHQARHRDQYAVEWLRHLRAALVRARELDSYLAIL